MGDEQEAVQNVRESGTDETDAPFKVQTDQPIKDRRCDYCGRRISEIKPVNGHGGKPVDNFNKGGEYSNNNCTAKGSRFIELVFVVGCGEDIELVCQIIDEVVAQDHRILADQERMGLVSELSNGSLEFKVPVQICAEDYCGSYYDISEKVKRRLDAEGIKMLLSSVAD